MLQIHIINMQLSSIVNVEKTWDWVHLSLGLHYEEEDCYVCLHINSFSEDPYFPLLDKMSDDIFQAMKVVEEANEIDSEISWILNERADDLTKLVNEK